MDEPMNCDQLNKWLRDTFAVFEGPPRAFFDLPVVYDANGVIMESRRIVYASLKIVGTESEACNIIRRMLTAIGMRDVEAMRDGAIPLFVRAPFSYFPKERSSPQGVYGRIAFWNPLDEAAFQVMFKAEPNFLPFGDFPKPFHDSPHET